jgi:hypothetical protein
MCTSISSPCLVRNFAEGEKRHTRVRLGNNAESPSV